MMSQPLLTPVAKRMATQMMILLMLIGFMTTQSFGQADEKAIAAEVQKYLKQLDSLSDDELQQKAETTCNEIIADLTYRPTIEAIKASRLTWQKYLTVVEQRIEQEKQALDYSRSSLSKQIKMIQDSESNSQVAENRIRNAIQAFESPIKSRLQMIQALNLQKKEIDSRIQSMSTREKLVKDDLFNSRNTLPQEQTLIALPNRRSSTSPQMDREPRKTLDVKYQRNRSSKSVSSLLAELGVTSNTK